MVSFSARRRIFVFLNCFLLRLTASLKIENLAFPSHAMLGQTVTMMCDYRVAQKEYIDSIKWYKDNREFYRIIFNSYINENRVVTFNQPGIKLNKEQSGLKKVGSHRLVLQDVSLKTSGVYRCQITLSGPPFHTEQRDKNLTVIIRPEGRPKITGLRPAYNSDEQIQVSCTSRRSYPAARLDFLIDVERASEDLIVRDPVDEGDGGILQTARIWLKYNLSPRRRLGNRRTDRYVDTAVYENLRDPNGYGSTLLGRSQSTSDVKLRLKCTAKIGNAYWESVVGETVLRHKERLLESRSSASTVGADRTMEATRIFWYLMSSSLSLAASTWRLV